MKTVFVTVGTTCFDKLVETVTSSSVLQFFSQKNYGTLIVQYGRGKEPVIPTEINGINVHCFSYKTSLQENIKNADLVISHSGAGSILEALEAQKTLIVVINEDLMGNHQLELAERFHKQKYLLYCKCCDLLTTLQDENLSLLQNYIPGDPIKFVHFVNRLMMYQ